jgi:hypothetical protein
VSGELEKGEKIENMKEGAYRADWIKQKEEGRNREKRGRKTTQTYLMATSNRKVRTTSLPCFFEISGQKGEGNRKGMT